MQYIKISKKILINIIIKFIILMHIYTDRNLAQYSLTNIQLHIYTINNYMIIYN